MSYKNNKFPKKEDILPPHTPWQGKPIQIIVRPGDNIEKCIKAFRTLVQKERVLALFKEKQGYEKPSVKKRRKRAERAQKLFETEQKRNRENHG